MKTFVTTAFAVAALTLTSACGSGDGGDGDRPTTEEISTSLQGSGNALGGLPVDEKSAECLADVLESSDLSDESLRALVEGDQDYEGSEKELDVLQDLIGDIAECTGSTGQPQPTDPTEPTEQPGE